MSPTWDLSADPRGDRGEDADPDWWISATARAFRAYNQAGASPEEQLVFVESLPVPLRYALVCLLYEGEINNGGMDAVFSCIGLLLPEITDGLAYYGLDAHAERLRAIAAGLGGEHFPRSPDELMEAFDARYPEARAQLLREAEREHWALPDAGDLRARIDARIRSEPEAYFRSATP